MMKKKVAVNVVVPTPERFSRLDIIDDHDLNYAIDAEMGVVSAWCSCDRFNKNRNMRGPWTLEAIKDEWLKHVQKVRDEMRGYQMEASHV